MAEKKKKTAIELLTDEQKARLREQQRYWKTRRAREREALLDKTILDMDKELARMYRASFETLRGQIAELWAVIQDEAAKTGEPLTSHLYRFDRYYEQINQIREKLNTLGFQTEDILEGTFTEYYEKNVALLEKQMEFTSQISEEKARQAIASTWCKDGKHWSTRIWDNNEKLAAALEQGLVDCAARGESWTTLSKELQDIFDTAGFQNVDRLVRTELAHIQTDSTAEIYKEMGVEYYTIIPEWATCCEICEALAADALDHPRRIDDLVIPAHPNCRCTIQSYIPPEKGDYINPDIEAVRRNRKGLK